jgi:hypothetical protein
MRKIDVRQAITILANLAVLAGLVALVVEIRTNSAAVQAAAVQESVNSTREYLLNIALDEDLSRIRQSGEENFGGLSEQEAFRFQLQSRGNWLYLQNLWIQRGLGILNDSAWASVERIICADLLAKPGWRQDWQNHSSVLDPQFVALAEGCSGLN